MKMEMTGNDLVGRIGYSDHGPVDLFIRKSKGLEQGAVGCPFQSFLHLIRSHDFILLSLCPSLAKNYFPSPLGREGQGEGWFICV